MNTNFLIILDILRSLRNFVFLRVITALFLAFFNLVIEAQMNFDLSIHSTVETAQKAFEEKIPKGTSRDKVMNFLKEEGIECFDDEAEIVACRVIEPSANMIHVVWSLAFYFDSLRCLERIVINRGYTGP